MKKDIFIFTNGELQRKNDTLLFDGEAGKKYIPVTDVESIHVFGEVNLNKSLLEFAYQQGIVLHFYNYYDYYVGSFYPREHLNSGYVILRQCQCYLDSDVRVQLARSFIHGAATNILQNLKYYGRRGCDLTDTIDAITKLAQTLPDQDSIEKIMAVEGNIRQLYYQGFNEILQNPDFRFVSRSKRPPKDKINSLISFGNSMMYTVVLSQIYQTQLDPRIGYLHSTNDRRFTLNLDVAEIFKPILVDRTIFSLLNRKALTGQDFGKELNGILLKENGRKTFIQELNSKLETTIAHPTLKTRVSYKQLIRMELYKLQKFVTEGEVYAPFEAKW